MARTASKDPNRWTLSSHSDKAGRTYVIAYRNKWIPELKQSRREATRHVGRLQADGRIAFSKPWLEDHPEYAEGNFYYEANEIVTRTPKEIEDAKKVSGFEYRQDHVQTGVTLGTWNMAIERGILEDLKEVFGPEVGTLLLQLGIYQMDDGSALMNYEDWLPMVYMPGAFPVESQRISEALSTVTQEKIDQYFRKRHQRSIDRLRAGARAGSNLPEMALAIDSTSISTYSNTIRDASWGHAKQDPELRQINLTLACDYATGETLYAYECDGSINDKTSFKDVLFRMMSSGFDLSRTILVTDRGYHMVFNVQKMLDLELRYVQGVPLIEDSVKKMFDKYRGVLTDPAYYSSEYGVSYGTVSESWTARTDAGTVGASVRLHLYFDEQVALDEKRDLLKCVDAVIRTKNEGRRVEPAEWARYRRFISEKQDGRSTVWVRNDSVIRSTIKYFGCFAIRTNEVTDPLEALSLYRRRNIVEQAFNQYKNQVQGSRLFSTQTTYMGKLLVHLIAQSLRMMLYMNAKNNAAANPGLKLPNESLSKALMVLRTLCAARPVGANHWILREPTKKQRDLLTLLGLDLAASKNRLLNY